MGIVVIILIVLWVYFNFIDSPSKKNNKSSSYNSSDEIKLLNNSDYCSSNNNSSTRRKTSTSSYSKPAKKVHPYTQETGKKVPKVDLYSGIIASKKEDRTVGYKYGTYIKDGILYTKKGEKIRNKEAYFAKAENRYISKHGKDENYLERKKQHKKDVDDFLEWKRNHKNR